MKVTHWRNEICRTGNLWQKCRRCYFCPEILVRVNNWRAGRRWGKTVWRSWKCCLNLRCHIRLFSGFPSLNKLFRAFLEYVCGTWSLSAVYWVTVKFTVCYGLNGCLLIECGRTEVISNSIT